MKLPDIRGILARLHTDRMTVYRYGYQSDGEDPEDMESILEEEEPVLRDIPCLLSYNGQDDPAPQEDRNEEEVQGLLICDPGVDLGSGDYVEVVRRGVTYAGRTGMPQAYTSSLQTPFLHRRLR